MKKSENNCISERQLKMKKINLICLFAVMILWINGCSLENTDINSKNDIGLEKFENSFVIVEFNLKYDKGQAPLMTPIREWCSNCGTYHSSSGGEKFIKQQRPFETSGILIGDNIVVVDDPVIEPRFIESISVRHNDEKVLAKIKSYAIKQNALLLELEDDFSNAQAVEFITADTKQLKVVNYDFWNGRWVLSSSSLQLRKLLQEGNEVRVASKDGLITDSNFNPLAINLDGSFADGNQWQMSPIQWDLYSYAQLNELLDKIGDDAEKNILKCKINLRSPSKSKQNIFNYNDSDEDDLATEINTIALIVDVDKALVLKELKAEVTARIEKITIFGQDGKELEATFFATLKDYGGFFVSLPEEVNTPITVSDLDIRDNFMDIMPAVQVSVQGENKVTYNSYCRIPSVEKGWKSYLYPEIGEAYEIEDLDRSLFVYDMKGDLVILPISKRQDANEDRYDSENIRYFFAKDIENIFGNIEVYSDSTNVPLTLEQENRITWLGVILQPLNRELAKLHNISDISKNGRIGAVISHVYPGSPADKAGIEPGMVILRLYSEDKPAPLELEMDMQTAAFRENFRFEMLSEIPLEYFSQIPTPWHNAKNELNNLLMGIGIGNKYTAEFYKDGEKVMQDFVVEQSPEYYDSTEKFKSEELGLSVRNLTFEVRRFYRKTPMDQGIIISDVQPGTKAAVAKVMPFEIITSVNDKAVYNVEDFKSAIEGQSSLKITIERMMDSRIVNIDMDK